MDELAQYSHEVRCVMQAACTMNDMQMVHSLCSVIQPHVMESLRIKSFNSVPDQIEQESLPTDLQSCSLFSDEVCAHER